MTRESFDILVSGGGVAGLAAAAAFGQAGFRTLCVDPAPPVTSESAAGADLRTTAFLQPSVALLERAGLWARLSPEASALQVMRIVDAGGPEPVARLIRDFDAADISDAPFGWNLPNWLLRREMVAHLATISTVEFCPGVATTAVLAREDAALVTLSNGRQIRAKLLIAADGRDSFVRHALGIAATRTSYGQKALVFSVTHDLAHENVSTEIHRSGGPFTLVPLPAREGQHASSVVWMERGPEAARLAALPEAAFEAEAFTRSCGILGALKLATPRLLWPIITQKAAEFTAPHTALIAEAAHVVPPIGAQGLNMSLSDVASLLDLAEAAPEALGSAAMLETYARARAGDIALRVQGIDLLNRASMLAPQPLRDLRAGALGLFYGIAPVRKALMKAGLGLR
ncbi:UbiH/UbiF family hydroxylase [Falsigemmobacter faecalis]|uniref:UbiH/UbiF family hydroxylase n=1 Tax=Falsigemmobacter faecalis TaxID=2488730 RepID=A0A3P3D4T7_9RHOB|nr:UbiH/UbiF family hydroxylase [Falsigemmobacter faecalis]RRH69410.1 UbiH/UbiF family hydroxylase [Falsigemmobacter faecalis]